MKETDRDEIIHDHNHDGVDRRGFLKCMAWAGTGALCVMRGGILSSYALGDTKKKMAGELSFVQLSDSHMGFNKPANPDVTATLQVALDRIKALPAQPEFLIHTGDVSHLSKPEQFDTVAQMLKGTPGDDVFYVPGEHDMIDDNGKGYLDRFGKNTQGAGWYTFDKKGVHFIGLVNVVNLKAGGLGTLGSEQLEWMEKVEGNVTFHTACSTAFPQPHPGAAPGPGPMKVPPEQLRSLLGITDVNYVRGKHALAVIDSNLA